MRKAIESYRRYLTLGLFTAMLFLSHVAIAADSVPLAKGQSTPVSSRQWLKAPITYNCTEKPIEQVLMELAEQAKVDIVKSPKVTGNVTVKLTNIPLEEALTNILSAHDYTYVATESMLRVITVSELVLAREELITRVYQINYADANDVAGALKDFVSRNGRVAFSKGTGHIIVTDTENKIKGIDKFIEQIDHITPQVLVEVRIYDVTSKEGFELSPDWHVGRNAPLTGDVIPYTETTTTLLEQARTEFWEETEGVYRDSDDVPGNSYTYEGWSEPGDVVETETKTIQPPYATNLRRKPFVGGSFDRQTGGTLSFGLLNDAVDIDFALSILHQQLEAKLLANPRVLVLDNQTANFEIIRQVPYRELLQVAREDPITYTEFKDVGVRLKVTPHIARDGMIRLHVMPEFGILVSQDAISVLATKDDFGRDVYQSVLSAPTVDTRRANTIAMIKNGQTIVMGGLRKRETSKDISKVPVLADIPLIGGLFKSETELVQINELVIFITTKIVTEPVLSDAEQIQYKATEMPPLKSLPKTKLERKYTTESDLETELSELLKLIPDK
ncbi:secretin N-terminal domain-containing protein [Planctomycetota bacterium]